MKYISLLWPQDELSYSSKTKKLNVETVNSLDLDGLCKSIGKNEEQGKTIKEILINMCSDEEVIKYRQEIFNDIISSEELIASFEDILNHLEDLKYLSDKSSIPEEANLWKFFSRFKELNGYVDCINAIRQTLQGVSFKSKGLVNLRNIILEICEDEEFKSLSKSVNSLSLEINEIKSINLGINLDTSLNPIEATLISVNKTKFKDNSWIKNLIPLNDGLLKEIGLISKIHSLSADRRHPIMYHLYKDIESFLKPVIRDLSSFLKRYTHIQGGFLVSLIPEVTFYLNCVRLIKCMKENGMPVCKPEIAKIEERKCIITDIFNINLAINMIKNGEKPFENTVFNNVNFDEHGRILILTGPNRGGKSVYTEGIGLAHVLFQAGIFVPGAYAAMSPVDSIFSHFPVEEKQTVELGRLGEEVKRLNQIFSEATSFSLVLLNESLASTSFTEGLYIAQDVVKALKYLEVRALFNTHMHELAAYADTINNEVSGDSKVISLVTGLIDGKRSYKIQPGAPLGKSYAKDIAVKHGVSFEQLIDIINKRKKAAAI